MRLIYLVGAVIISFFGLLVAFSNVGSQYSFKILFSDFSGMPLTMPFLLMMLIGMGAGALLALYFFSSQDSSSDDSVF